MSELSGSSHQNPDPGGYFLSVPRTVSHTTGFASDALQRRGTRVGPDIANHTLRPPSYRTINLPFRSSRTLPEPETFLQVSRTLFCSPTLHTATAFKSHKPNFA